MNVKRQLAMNPLFNSMTKKILRACLPPTMSIVLCSPVIL
jgi:hypothetical protein